LARPLRALLLAASIAVIAYVAWIRFAPAPAPALGNDAAPRTAAARPERGGELVASIRSEPAVYNRYSPAGGTAPTDLLALLTHSRLVRVNRATDGIEPLLAQDWTESADGRTFTIRLREGVTFSDGEPFTSADVLFSFRAAYDPAVNSSLRASLQVDGQPLEVSAPDARTVVIRFPAPFAPGLRPLDSLPILPRHKLEAALAAGTFNEEWVPSKPIANIVGLGPFVLREHTPGQRLVFERNPRYFRRDDRGVQLPYLDRLTVAVVPDQSTEALRLEAGETDLMVNGDVRPADYAGFKRLADQGRLVLTEVGVGIDPDFLSFNLRPARAADPRAPWLSRKELRQAISHAVDRQAIVNAVYLGAAVPIYGPVSPGNRTWFAPTAAERPHDAARARQLLAAIGLTDRNGDGTVESADGRPARFSIVTQAGHIRERVTTVIQEQLRQVGIQIDVVPLDPGGIFQRWSAGDYDAIYFGVQASSTDPALNPEFWPSHGMYHFWNPRQKTPATGWEAKIDGHLREQATARRLEDRQRAFAEVQRVLGEELPAVYFVAPRVTLATSPRVANATAAPQLPQLLWNADSLASSGARP
jgi:peptide/nickel transport system substrate-binding protein